MANYAWRGRPIETLTRDELLEALKQALDHVAELDGIASPIYLTPEKRATLQAEKNRLLRAALDGLA